MCFAAASGAKGGQVVPDVVDEKVLGALCLSEPAMNWVGPVMVGLLPGAVDEGDLAAPHLDNGDALAGPDLEQVDLTFLAVVGDADPLEEGGLRGKLGAEGLGDE